MESMSAASIVAIIVALGTAVSSVIVALRTKQDVSHIKNDVRAVGSGLDQVHTAVNTNYQRMEKRLETADAKISALEKAAADAETTRAVLAAEAVKHGLPPEVARAAEALLAANRAISAPPGLSVTIPEVVVPVEDATEAPRIIKP